MHDPMTQAFCIRYPWFRRVTWGNGRYHEEFITIWHVDPEKGGGDDSCDWSGLHGLSDEDRAWLRKEGEQEHKHFFRGILKYDDLPDGSMVENTRGERWPGGMIGASSFEAVYGIATAILWRMPGKNGPMHQRWFSSWRLNRALAVATPMLLGLVSCSADNLHHLIGEARACDDSGQKAMGELFVAVARSLRRDARPWWRHPRWHLHHWSIRLNPLGNLKRWLTRRCADCGTRFQWGYAPIHDSNGYHHHQCSGRAMGSK